MRLTAFRSRPAGRRVEAALQRMFRMLGGLAPVPGGMGVMEGAIITGLMSAGVPQEQAVPTTFTYRLITSYLPPVWGYPAIFWLRKHEYL